MSLPGLHLRFVKIDEQVTPGGHAVMVVFPYVAGMAQGMLKASAEGSGCLKRLRRPRNLKGNNPCKMRAKKALYIDRGFWAHNWVIWEAG